MPLVVCQRRLRLVTLTLTLLIPLEGDVSPSTLLRSSYVVLLRSGMRRTTKPIKFNQTQALIGILLLFIISISL